MRDFAASSTRRRLAILLLAFAAYWPVLRLGFLWDDHTMIENNPAIRHWSANALRHDFTTDAFEGQGDPYYRPLMTIANRVDYTLWGLHPAGYHVTNLLAHAGNGLLIDAFLIALGFSPLIALYGATLFVVHPIGVEQLMIIAGRAELFGFLLTLATILLLMRDRTASCIGACVTFTLGLFSKESVIITPLLAAAVFYFKRGSWDRYLRIIPLILIAIPYLWIRTKVVGPAVAGVPAWTLTLFFVKAFPAVLLRYAALILVPWHLHSHRLMPHLSRAWPLFLALWVGGFAYALRANRRTMALCLFWFVICFLPKTPGMFHGNFMLDHWAYPAAIAILLPLALAFERWSAIPYVVALVILALLVHLNVVLRGTDERMYRWALRFTNSHPLQANLGALLLQENRPSEAIPFLENVYALYPENSSNTNALAEAYWLNGDHARAIAVLKDMVRRKPNDPLTLHNLQVIQGASNTDR